MVKTKHGKLMEGKKWFTYRLKQLMEEREDTIWMHYKSVQDDNVNES